VRRQDEVKVLSARASSVVERRVSCSPNMGRQGEAKVSPARDSSRSPILRRQGEALISEAKGHMRRSMSAANASSGGPPRPTSAQQLLSSMHTTESARGQRAHGILETLLQLVGK
jgi:hypothetical protein